MSSPATHGASYRLAQRLEEIVCFPRGCRPFMQDHTRPGILSFQGPRSRPPSKDRFVESSTFRKLRVYTVLTPHLPGIWALPLARIPKAARLGGVLPVDMRIPRHHDKFQYHDFSFILPVDFSEGPFYVITRGLLVGVFARW